MKSLLILFTILSTTSVFGSTQCDSLKVHYLENTNRLATLMGKYKIFDMKVLNSFKDNQKLTKGSIVVITSKNNPPEVVFGKQLGTKWSYTYSNAQLTIKLSPKSKKIKRNIASFAYCKR